MNLRSYLAREMERGTNERRQLSSRKLSLRKIKRMIFERNNNNKYNVQQVHINHKLKKFIFYKSYHKYMYIINHILLINKINNIYYSFCKILNVLTVD